MNTQPVPVSQLLVWRRAIQGLFNQHPFNLLSDLGKRTEPILVFRVAGEKIYFFNEPDLVKEVLVTCHAKLRKGRGLDRVKQTLGNGLLTSEGDLHRQQRRIIQPVFNHRNLQAYADPMIARVSRVSASWKDSQPVNMTAAMMALTLSIVCQTLFGADVESETHRVGELMTKIIQAFPLLLSPFAGFLEKIGVAKLREAAAARAELHGIVQRMIAERRSSRNQGSDVLSLLFATQDQETGTGMSEQQLEDEVTTIFMAGHETTANALAWTFYLLAQHPGFDRELRVQLCHVLGERQPELAQLPKMTLLDQLIHESLRLYPPAWSIGRRAIEDVQIGSAEISKGSLLVVSPYASIRKILCASNGDASRTMDRSFSTTTPEVRVFPVRRRSPPMHRRRICLDGAEIASRCSAARLEGGVNPGPEYSPKTCNHLEVKPSDSRGGASGLKEAGSPKKLTKGPSPVQAQN